jgi:hypothetical protein
MSASEICGILDKDLVNFIHNIIVILKIAVPILLVIFGMIDFAKGVTAGKEDEIKKGQDIFIKRLIAAACVFFVVTIVQLVMSLVSSDDDSFWSCANGILNGTEGIEYNVDEGVPGGNSNFEIDDNGSVDNQGGFIGPVLDNGNVEQKNYGTISKEYKDSTGIECIADPAYDEYDACVNTWHLDEAICHSALQNYCKSSNSSVLWNRKNYLSGNEIADKAVIDNIKQVLSVSQCNSFSGKLSLLGDYSGEEYLLEFASCFESNGKTKNALENCRVYFNGLCK